MPEVSAGSNQVGANVTLLPHVTCPCGPAAPVEPGQRRTLEPVSRAENFRSSRRLRSPAEQVAILIPLGSLKRDDFSSNRHLALTSCWSMIFPETGTHFSGSCSSSNAAPIRARKEICVPETGIHTSYTTCAPSAILKALKPDDDSNEKSSRSRDRSSRTGCACSNWSSIGI